MVFRDLRVILAGKPNSNEVFVIDREILSVGTLGGFRSFFRIERLTRRRTSVTLPEEEGKKIESNRRIDGMRGSKRERTVTKKEEKRKEDNTERVLR